MGIQQLYCFSIVKEVLDLAAAITILLGVVFAQMMYHHSVNQQMSLKLGCLSAILESLVGFDVQKYRSPAIRLLSDWKKCT